MIFYHGTTEGNWKLIQKEGQLYGISRVLSNDRKKVISEHRLTYLATTIEEARCYGDVVLEVNYEPNDRDNNHFDKDCWQIRVYKPIPLSDIKIIEY